MYSGTTLRTKSGRVLGAHQKIDRLARRNLKRMIPRVSNFPHITAILHFEGRNGPDGIKAKSPGQNEPWHYIDPNNPDDRQLFQLIEDHTCNLAQALRDNETERAAFEAAWLAHAIVDGLTPAHHYPLAEKIEELWGKPHTERTTIRDKNIIRGDTRRDSLRKNWEYWGAKGIFTTHFMFEFGFATTISPLRYNDLAPTPDDIARVKQEGILPLFEETLHALHAQDMYKDFYKHGWTAGLARKSRVFLAPAIINLVTLAWYAAYNTSQKDSSR